MFSDKLQLNLINRTTIRNAIDDTHFAQGQAGFVKNGAFAWTVHESTLEILSTESGVKIAHYNFNKNHAARGSVITCVEEIDYLPGVCLLAVATEFTTSGASGGLLSIFCVQGSKILGSMDFCERITCCRYIEQPACQRSVLRQFQGVIAIGTDQGKLFIIDLMLPANARKISSSPSYDSELFPCVNTLANVEQSQISINHQRVSRGEHQLPEKSFFSIQLEVLKDSGAILSILCMPNLYTMAIGLSDGRMVLYDLSDLQAFHLAFPPSREAPLTHMSFLEPTDDPKCAVYVWAFHSSASGAVAVMHSLMFASCVDRVYEDFKSCSVRLTMPINVKDTFPICCRSITRSLSQDDEDILTLNVLAWTSPTMKTTHVMIFDLNQWYKEQMPPLDDWRKELKYVAVFEIQDCASLDVHIHESSVFPFNSILRPEAHFYPNSLSFDACTLESDRFSHYRWIGLQNIALQQFNVSGPQVILEPNFYFNALLQVAIVPQFSDMVYNVATPINLKREFLLSVALEYNYNGFLKRCACAWADGSYLGKDDSVGIGLSTLTDWIWNRVRAIKEVCNELCQPLFDFSEQRIDYGTQKQLSQCCKQLKILSDLLIVILRDHRQFIPEHILTVLQTQSETITMASDYQEVLQWLLNVGLLPEGHHEHDNSDDFLIVPYPYIKIRSYYNSQRMKLADEWNDSVAPSKFLFIDAFIERECNAGKLREVWKEAYPPVSIQALLRTLLVPDIPLHHKHVIFVYLFMDITNVLSDGIYASIVRNLIKFPAVFKMNPSMIKRTQAFWNLDNGRLDTAVEELISPLSHDKHLPLWQRELLIGALLKQNVNSLALRALRCPGNPIAPVLEMLTLLANNLMSEALKVQRASGDRNLLEKLFEKILQSPNHAQLLDLSLTEEEGKVLREYLQTLSGEDSPNHLNMHFVYLLQRSKFLDAAQLVESFNNDTNMNLEPPKQVLNAYFATMESTTRRLTSMAYGEDVQAKESPLPLSVNLIQAKCNPSNDIYQTCVQSISEAAYDTTQEAQKLPFLGNPSLGIFEYRQSTLNHQDLSYSLEINEHGKRKQARNDEVIRIEDLEAPQQKRRRLSASVTAKKRSYADTCSSQLTVFRESKAKFNFVRKSPGSSSAVSPDRVHTFGNFLLNTPIVPKKTPPRRLMPEKCETPHSILKTRSCRGSVSPAPSRISEFGESVKSITFALPDSRDTSMNDSFNEEPMESSAEVFFSPDKVPKVKIPTVEGPKARKSIKSRTASPVDKAEATGEEVAPPEVGEGSVEVETSKLDDTVSSSDSQDYGRPFRVGNVLKSSSDDDSSTSSDELPDKSIYNYVRRSVLPADYGEISDSSVEEKPADQKDSDDSVEDEHFEEEELPEHSDYDDSSDQDGNGNGFEYGDVNLEDSDDSEARTTNEVICIDSSSEDDAPAALPSFGALGSVHQAVVRGLKDMPVAAPSSDYAELANVPPAGDDIAPSQEEMFSILYDNLDGGEKMETEEDDEIASPPFEPIGEDDQPTSTSSIVDVIGSSHEMEQDLIPPQVETVPETKEKAAASSTTVEVEEGASVEPESQLRDAAKPEAVKEAAAEPEVAEKPPAEPEVEEEASAAPEAAEEASSEPKAAEEASSAPKATEEASSAPEAAGKGSAEPEAAEEASWAPKATEEASSAPEAAEEASAERKAKEKPSPELSDAEQATKNPTSSEEASTLIAKEAPPSGEPQPDILELQIPPEVKVTAVDDISGLSEECSFVSATADDLNEAVWQPDAMDSYQLLMNSDLSVITSNPSSENPLNIATSSIYVTPEGSQEEAKEPQPIDLTTKPKTLSVEPSGRQLRGKSVPTNIPSPKNLRSKRAATEDREDPKNLLKGKIAERFEEAVTPVPSPGVLTRRRSQILESESPRTPSRLTRQSSVLSDEGSESSKVSTRRTSTGTPTTPRRMTRATSKESSLYSETEKSPDEPGQLSRQRSTRKRVASASSTDDAKSTRSTRSSAKKATATSTTKVTPEKESSVEPADVPSATNRRLTRRQMQVLEKSRELSEKMSATGALRATKSEDFITTQSKSDDSDNESLKSDSGSVKSRASRKRKTSTKAANDDAKRLSLNKLSVIPEESTIDEPSAEAATTKRGRKTKK